jgi:CRP-like cAMP-binding protein
MEHSRRFISPGNNRLLAALPGVVRSKLAFGMEKVSVAPEQVLYEFDTPITHIWFPISGVISLAVTMKNEAVIEVATIGNEGLVGLPAAFGADRGLTKALGQVPGEAMKMRVDAFRLALDEYPELRDMVERYTVAMMSQIMRSTACNHAHTVQERMCRWLLMTHDRVGEDEFRLTQEFLALMLGVRRPSVTVCAGKMQKAGLISYQHGRIRVLDRAGLEARSCECYAVVRREFERMLPEPSSSKDKVELRP